MADDYEDDVLRDIAELARQGLTVRMSVETVHATFQAILDLAEKS